MQEFIRHQFNSIFPEGSSFVPHRHCSSTLTCRSPSTLLRAEANLVSSTRCASFPSSTRLGLHMYSCSLVSYCTIGVVTTAVSCWSTRPLDLDRWTIEMPPRLLGDANRLWCPALAAELPIRADFELLDAPREKARVTSVAPTVTTRPKF